MNIDQVLDQAPSAIARLETESEESRFIWKSSEIQLAQLQAKLHLKTKAESPDLTQSDLKAKVEADDALYEMRMRCLTLESAYKKTLIDVNKWVTAFTSARKKASLKIEEMRSLNAGVGSRQ